MPWIKVDGPKLNDVDKKRKLVEKLTDAASEVYGLERSTISVVIKENDVENVGVGGLLLADMVKK